MTIWSLFNTPRRVVTRGAPSASGLEMDDAAGTTVATERQGVFVTPQSITTFAGATGVVTLLWRSAGALHPGWESNPRVAFVCALVIGLLIYVLNETDPTNTSKSARDRLVNLAIAFINTLVLYSATVGATAVVTGTP